MGFVIYLDHNATTPILPEVLEAMMPYLTTEWGNPSSAYKFGAKLKSVIATAREQVAELIGAHPMDVIFTSCATESNNAAIAAESMKISQARIIVLVPPSRCFHTTCHLGQLALRWHRAGKATPR